MAKKNQFNLSHAVKTTLDIGNIIPITHIDCVQGDEFNIDPQIKVNFSPLVGPVMGLFKLKVRGFFVPYRQIWNQFPQHYAENNNISYAFPFRTVDLNLIRTYTTKVYQHLGLGLASATQEEDINCLPIRAYQKIIMDHYYKQGISGVPEDTDFFQTYSGEDNQTNDNIWPDFYDDDIYTAMLSQQFYSSEPTATSPVSLQDLANMVSLSKQRDLTQRFIFRAQDLINHLFGNNNQSDMVQKIYEKDYFFTFNDITNVASSASYPLGISQSLVSASAYDKNIKFKADSFGILMFCISVVPILPDMGGTREDMIAPTDGYFFYNPNFANSGRLPVKWKHLSNLTASAETTAGYNHIYERYRGMRNIVGGAFLDTYTDLIVHRNLSENAITDFKQVIGADYDYLFDSFDLPQIRAFGTFNINASRPVVKVIELGSFTSGE